jgi:hypothetical protein
MRVPNLIKGTLLNKEIAEYCETVICKLPLQRETKVKSMQ